MSMAGIQSFSLMMTSALVFSLAFACGVYGVLQIEVSPRRVDVGETRSLHVHCSYVPENGQGMDALVSLVVSGVRATMPQDENSTSSLKASDTHVLQDIASISVFSKQEVAVLSNLNVVTSGFIQPRERSYVSFVVHNPNFDIPDTYKCSAHGIRKNGQPMVMSDNVQVVFIKSSLNENLRQSLDNLVINVEETKVHFQKINRRQLEQYKNLSDDVTDLSSKQLSQDMRIGTLEAELETFENKSNQLVSRVADLEKLRVEDDSEVQSKLGILEAQNENSSAQIFALETKVKQIKNKNEEMSSLSYTLEEIVDEILKGKNDTAKREREFKIKNKNRTNQTSISSRILSVAEMQVELRQIKDALLEDTHFVSPRSRESFYFLPKNDKGRSILSSEARCQIFGGYLVEINDKIEYDFIVKFINGLPGFKTVFTGAERETRHRDWVYRRSKQRVSFTQWKKGEPNNLVNENCLTLEKSMGWEMNDNICDASNDGTFLCEASFDDFHSLFT